MDRVLRDDPALKAAYGEVLQRRTRHLATRNGAG